MRKILTFALAFILLLTPVSATETETGGGSETSWDAYIIDFFRQYSIDPETITLGYYNTVTGEEHYHNGDKYMVGASIYKVPLNMYFAELVSGGEMTMETEFSEIPYAYIQKMSIQNSNNALSEILQAEFDSYADYRMAIAKYLGVSDEEATENYLTYNIFTSRQMVHCLKMLYAEPERYPDVLNNMLLASPGSYLELYINGKYEVAQKYGFLNYEDATFVHTVGIIYTQEPIIVTFFSYDCRGGLCAPGRYAKAMCEYAEMTVGGPLVGDKAVELSGQGAEPEPEPTPEASAEPAPEVTMQPVSSTNIAEGPKAMPEITSEPVPVETQPPAEDPGEERNAAMPIYIAFALYASAAVLGLIFKKKRLVIFAVAAMVVCAAAYIALLA